jgi:iron complex outermembrane receptor protein
VGCALLLGAALCVGTAAAQEAAESKGSTNVFTLGEIEVTDTVDASGNPTAEAVTSEQMQQFNAETLTEAVRMVPGVSFDFSGARNEQMVRVRGFDQKHVPIYLDGVPIYVPYDGYPDVGRFTTFDLSEVVVSKGFTSVLYGPNTMGGAINMVSRKPSEEFEGDAGVRSVNGGYASYLNVGSNQGSWYFQGGASYLDSDGWWLPDSFEETTLEDGDERDNSYISDGKLSLKVGLTPNETDEYSFTYIYQRGEKGTPPYIGTDPSTRSRYWQWPYWTKESYYLNTNTALGESDDYYVKTRLFYDKFRNMLMSYDNNSYTTQTFGSTFDSPYDDHTLGGSMELGTYVIEDHTVKLALHYKRDNHREHNKGNPIQEFAEDIYSAGLEDTWDVTEQFYLIGGLGFDYVHTAKAENNVNGEIEEFDKGSSSAFNPQLGAFYRVTEGGLAHLSVAQKSRMPSIKDKFSYRMGTVEPNPNLEPERSVNYELGYDQRFNETGAAGVAVFYNDITDYILSVDIGGGLSQNQNIGKVEQYGVELSLSGNIVGGLEGGINYTWLQFNNLTNDEYITDTPENTAFGYLRYFFMEGLSLQADCTYNSRTYSNSDGGYVAGEHYVLGSKLQYEPTDFLSFNVGVENLLDQNYELDEGYPEPGRNFFAGVDVKF